MMWSIMKLQVQVASELHHKSKQKRNAWNLRIQPVVQFFTVGSFVYKLNLKVVLIWKVSPFSWVHLGGHWIIIHLLTVKYLSNTPSKLPFLVWIMKRAGRPA